MRPIKRCPPYDAIVCWTPGSITGSKLVRCALGYVQQLFGLNMGIIRLHHSEQQCRATLQRTMHWIVLVILIVFLSDFTLLLAGCTVPKQTQRGNCSFTDQITERAQPTGAAGHQKRPCYCQGILLGPGMRRQIYHVAYLSAALRCCRNIARPLDTCKAKCWKVLHRMPCHP